MKYQWTVVIFASRENLFTLSRAIQSASASTNCSIKIDVLVNGNDALANDIANWLLTQNKVSLHAGIRIWKIPQAGKANAWNMYIQHIWTGESLVFFIDGYVRLNSDSVSLLGNAVLSSNIALGGSGVPSVGRSAGKLREQMIEHGGFHGNFCCVKGSAIACIREKKIRLPFGMYRVDSYFGALLSFNFRPNIESWNKNRILVHPEATWNNDVLKWWSISDVSSHLRRMLRQSRGVLENAAVKESFVNQGVVPENIPDTAAELVMNWVSLNSIQFRKIVKGNWLTLLAFKDIKEESKKTPNYQSPILVCEYENVEVTII